MSNWSQIEKQNLETPISKHRKTLKENRFTPYQDYLDSILDTALESKPQNLPDIEDSEVELLLNFSSQSSHLNLPNCPPTPVSSPLSLEPFSPNFLELNLSPCPFSPTWSESTLPAEEHSSLLNTPTSSPSPNYQANSTPDSSPDISENSEFPPHIESLLLRIPSSTEEPELSSKTKESNTERASSNNTALSPQTDIRESQQTAEVPPLPVLSAADVDTVLYSPTALYSPISSCGSESPSSPPFQAESIDNPTPPSLLQITVCPTEGLLEILKQKKEKTKRFRKKPKSPKRKIQNY